jgi:CheY-like chemotaxis protein/anti-sigma regulatory factor (Ser/Thr protein kinase)
MSLIDDILDFSKMESGKLHLDSMPFLLEEMLDQVFSTMEELCRSKHLKLILPSIAQGVHAVLGDPQRLRQILINLIGNSIKFTERGQIEVTLTELKRTTEHTTLEFSIIDTGIGMSELQQSRLFTAFSQGDSSITRTYGGTGLGLVISKQLIEQMDGTIRVDSQENVGSCFSFTVRLGISTLENVRQYQPHPRKEINTRQLQKLQGARILLVEDNEVNRIVAIELLTQAQLQVDTAENGEIALLKLKQNTYDCVLMDVQMPKMDGYETTRNLRKLPGCTDLPVIAMTANVMSVDRQKCQQAGMDDFIGKPILPETLYSVLIKWIKLEHPQNLQLPNLSKSPELPFMYGIDNAIGLEHTAGDKTVYRKILQKFAENHHGSMREIAQALAENNTSVVYQQVHTLKGLAGSLGALSLQNHLQRLEESLAEINSNVQNIRTIDNIIALTSQEFSRVINSIQSTLPAAEPSVELKPTMSSNEIKRHLLVLFDKLQAFDSDADQQLDLILSSVEDQSLMNELLLIRKQIANYQFIDAAQALTPLLDFSTR